MSARDDYKITTVWGSTSPLFATHATYRKMADEIDALRARVAVLEAERDGNQIAAGGASTREGEESLADRLAPPPAALVDVKAAAVKVLTETECHYLAGTTLGWYRPTTDEAERVVEALAGVVDMLPKGTVARILALCDEYDRLEPEYRYTVRRTIRSVLAAETEGWKQYGKDLAELARWRAVADGRTVEQIGALLIVAAAAIAEHDETCTCHRCQLGRAGCEQVAAAVAAIRGIVG